MEKKTLPFQLEETVPGTFALQGLLGGMIGGLVYMFVLTLSEVNPETRFLIHLSPWVLLAGSIVGEIKAVLMWTVYRLTGIRMRSAARVGVTFTAISLIGIFIGIWLGVRDQTQFAINLAVALLIGLPTALLVGSSVKPWELFTFGSIAVGPSQCESRLGSRSVLGTLGTLPLRFLSIATLATWILVVACQRGISGGLLATALAVVIPSIYPAFSAYVTFRSPHKAILLLVGLLLNVPVGLFALFAPPNYTQAFWAYQYNDMLFYLGWICIAFVIAWAIFLVARLSARTEESTPRDVLNDSLPKAPIESEHHCLGSRFLDWETQKKRSRFRLGRRVSTLSR